jgi:hypothetical protein
MYMYTKTPLSDLQVSESLDTSASLCYTTQRLDHMELQVLYVK